MSEIKVMIVDDQPIIRDGLKMILDMYEDIEVVGVATNGSDAISICKEKEIDVILMDIRMPDMDGVEATKRIKAKHEKIKIIILTTFDDDEYIFEALKQGASSYLLKDMNSDEIVSAIRVVKQGGSVMPPKVTAKVVNKFAKISSSTEQSAYEHLTEREMEIIKHIAAGMSNKEIAKALYLSQGTVKNHITNILSKLNMRDRTQVALYAIENKII